MNRSNVLIGSPIAIEERAASISSASHLEVPETLHDLLHILVKNPPSTFSMLRTTCSLLSTFYGRPPKEITLNTVSTTRDGFRPFLESRMYANASIRSYVNYVRILLKEASALGWRPGEKITEEWRSVIMLTIENKCADLAKHLAQLRKRPSEVTVEDVDSWVEKMIQGGRTYREATLEKGRFWRLLRAYGCTEQLPLCLSREKGYGVPLDQFPPTLKNEVVELLKWKRAEFALDRPKNARIRLVSSEGIQDTICQLFGFAAKFCGETSITTLLDLVQKPIVWKFIEWKINERKVKARSLQLPLGRLSAAMRQHPKYSSLDHRWLKVLLDGLPAEPESERKRRKANKYLEYEVLESIAGEIHAGRNLAVKKGPWYLALQVRNELLMKWLPILPWRQRNVRECRIGGPNPNLFRSKIPPFSDIDKPEWVIEDERKNPDAEFWQFRFNFEETKTGIDVHAVLPRPLIGPLEEYLKDFRHRMLRGPDPGLLFVNQVGRPMTEDQVTVAVGDLTQQYGGKRVTPHPFRDIVAFTWLKHHPKDYLTLSKLLWHADVKTTINEYGSRFNESCGVSAMDAWLQEREAKRQSK